MSKNFLVKMLMLFIFLLVFNTKAEFSFAQDIKIMVDGTYLTSYDIIIIDNRVLVPYRTISEYLGYEVNWDEDYRFCTVANINKQNMNDDALCPMFIVLFTEHPVSMALNQDTVFTELEKHKQDKDYKPYDDYLYLLKSSYDDYTSAINAEIAKKLKSGELIAEYSSIDVMVNKLNEKFGKLFYFSNLKVPAKIINDKTYVPLRFVAEIMGARVQWDEPQKTVIIYR
ncbi:copper amine oxidase N-terminal domain-containing protein [Criibacterium bergeronii]|uniref:Copper amine oxidase N-terminal domain-containing protein n=1 Tax=Criibacterium bergeronii TaxID=1871336 RepID=A0A371IJY2_9FIRM|nr:copper amine oxidase N-terminal domain-containing protein [Criibacterium bergeronii]MBS6063810.1 copper amine oxidase N-terminal domain-containing protein [Peptostreptococcaceae bacterium]RDY20770.1 copper amine oxidase N-terminal domain-containing protein [Criibacterium bergeronii]